MSDRKKQIEMLLTKGVTQCTEKENLEKKLNSWEQLVIKFGIDPTGSRVHLGHMVPFLKLREFQKLGHKVVLLFGDTTAQIGDTSDKDSERPMLSKEETTKNAQEFLKIFSKIIDLSTIEVYFNSEGLNNLNVADLGELCKNFSVAEMLARDNFTKRFNSWKRISLQEFLYPVLQGFDSVAIAKKFWRCDVELWGNDQLFNLLAGRRLLDSFDFPKQDILMTDLLLGTNGEKMSKTKWNCIFLDDTPHDIFQKVLNLKDDLILHFFELVTDISLDELEDIKKRINNEHPKVLKEVLAKRIIKMLYWTEDIDQLDVKEVSSLDITVKELLSELQIFKTSWDMRNSINQWSVKINWNIISDSKEKVNFIDRKILLEVWKRIKLHVQVKT